MLQWPFRNHRHWWNVLLNNDGSKIKYYSGQKPYENGFYDHYPKGKVLRKTYKPNENAFLFKTKNPDITPPLLRDVFYKDVTSEYENVYDVSVPIDRRTYRKGELGYLSVFDNTRWAPIWGGECKKGQCSFEATTARAMYLPVLYTQNGINAFYAPFNILKNGKPQYRIPQMDSLIDLSVKRKYPFIHHNTWQSNRVRNGIFEAANQSDFSDANTLWQVAFYVDGEYYDKKNKHKKSLQIF